MNSPAAPGDSTERPGGPAPPGLPDLTSLLPKGSEDVPIKLIEAHLRAEQRGEPTIDPLQFSEKGRKLEARRRGLEPMPDGTYKRIRGAGKRGER